MASYRTDRELFQVSVVFVQFVSARLNEMGYMYSWVCDTYQDRVSKHILGTNCYEFSVGGSEYEHLTLKKCSSASSTALWWSICKSFTARCRWTRFHQAGYHPEMSSRFTMPTEAHGEVNKTRDLPCTGACQVALERKRMLPLRTRRSEIIPYSWKLVWLGLGTN